jgi:F-type H+-transporting ATPase subunit epsilon
VSPGTLDLEIVTPDGVAVHEDDLEVVVFRRRERRFELGSEIAVFPHHAPLLVRIPPAPMRYRRRGETIHVAIDGGFVEVLDDRVRIVTPRVERVAPGDPHPRATAAARCRDWQRAARDPTRDLAGYP